MVLSKEQKDFTSISQTGGIFAIYKATDESCPCKQYPDEDEMLFNEPDPTHKECFGTGIKRILYFSPKVRYMYSGATKTSNLEHQDFERIKNNTLTIFFPHNVNISMRDIICSLKINEFNEPVRPYEVEYVFKPIAVDRYIENNFKFFVVKASKLQHVPFAAIIE